MYNNKSTIHRFYFGVIFPLTLLVFSNCKKDITVNSSSIVGNWELRVAYNGQGGQTSYPPGNNNILRFTSSTYETYSKGQLIRSGQYALVKDTFHMTGELRDRIIYDNEYNSVQTFVQVVNNTLYLSIDAYDAPGAEYKRQ